MNKNLSRTFNNLPKLMQVTMVHSAGIPKTDEEVRKLAEHMQQL